MPSPRNRGPAPLRRLDGSRGARPDEVPRTVCVDAAQLQRLDDPSRVGILRIDLCVFSPDAVTGAAPAAMAGRPDGFHRLHTSLDGEAAAPGLAITLRRSAIESRLRALTRAPLGAPLVFEPRLFLSPCGRARAEDRLRHLLEGLKAGEDPEVVASLEAALMTALLTTCRHNYSRRFQSDGTADLPRHLKRVEAYILENADKPISMKDLEGVAEVSARSRSTTPFGGSGAPRPRPGCRRSAWTARTRRSSPRRRASG